MLAVLLLVAAALAWGQEAAPPPVKLEASVAAEKAAAPCRYCRVALDADEFCHWCGRLSMTATSVAASRFWGDAAYLLVYPPRSTALTIDSEFSDRGLVRETVSLPSGDRYTMVLGKKGQEVEGHVNYGRAAKGSDFKAVVEDRIDAGRLQWREIRGKISGDPDYHFYRRLDYLYAGDGRLERIRFGTWLYAGVSDREKEPASWHRHAVGEVVMVREESGLVRLETSYQEGRRSLRGEPEYADPTVTVESIRRAADGAIERLVTPAR